VIYLNCEVKSGLGEDTFWTWFEREFTGCSFDVPTRLRDEDILLRYSTLGFLPIEGKQVALCWELYPQMKTFFALDQWEQRFAKIYECARYSTYRTVATAISVSDYEQFGSVDVIPIGVNTDLYKPLHNKEELRKKYHLPQDCQVGIWIGTCHPMKGYGDLLRYASNHPEIYWIIIWKWQMEALPMMNASNYVKIPQAQINELLNAADFFASTNKLNSFFMAEWEAMASNIHFKIICNENREFIPSERPREDVVARGWDRRSVKQQWEKYLAQRGVKW
jgi:glycosyltransferase involved in cell wall biosynthesis